ncbi:MAG: hypothetical protein GEU93_10690 [Propionibacteriales bacterium]|nr:hypothetical protein [Propionibacteriales bacterium]
MSGGVRHEVIARRESERGEVVARRREDDVLELRVNGVFVMDTAETHAELLLAQTVLDTTAPRRRILVGGLGLGYTVREMLADRRVEHVVVAEIEPAIVDWMRSGVLPGADLLDDARVEIRLGDVRRIVAECPGGSLDAVLLDVDNGPDFLVYDENAALYERRFITECRRVLDTGGVLSIWSSTSSEPLRRAIADVFGDAVTRGVPVRLQERDETYYLIESRVSSRTL